METDTFELHVFVGPVEPDEATVARFREACTSADEPMKALLLRLDFAGRGFLGVLQSSRYVRGPLEDAVRAAGRDAAALRAAGLAVVREKIEAVATSPCVPQSAEDPRAREPARYFEVHLLFAPVGEVLTEAHERALEEVSRACALALGRPVPRSYNAFKPSLRFLNLRAYGVGLDGARTDVEYVAARVERTGLWARVKVLEEYVSYDTNRALDQGWLEPLEG